MARMEKAAATLGGSGRKRRMSPSAPEPVRTNSNISRRYTSPWRKSRPASAVQKYEKTVEQTPSAAAQTSMRQIACPTRPRRSDATMKGNAGTTLRNGARSGMPIRIATPYDRAVPPTMAAGTNAGFITGDYTPRMKRFSGAAVALAGLALQGCLASNFVLHVAPDGHGRAVVTTRLFESSFRAVEALFGEQRDPPEPIENQLTT